MSVPAAQEAQANQAQNAAEMAHAQNNSSKSSAEIGTASYNSLNSALNYGSGLGQYGWESINAVERLLARYKKDLKSESFSKDNIKQSINDINLSLPANMQIQDANKLCDALLKDGPDNIDEAKWVEAFKKNSSSFESASPEAEKDFISKVSSKYKELTQDSDAKYEDARRKLATEFYKHPLINKLSPEIQILDAAVALFGGPAAFVGHILGATVKNVSAGVLPILAKKLLDDIKNGKNGKYDKNESKDAPGISLSKEVSGITLSSRGANDYSNPSNPVNPENPENNLDYGGGVRPHKKRKVGSDDLGADNSAGL